MSRCYYCSVCYYSSVCVCVYRVERLQKPTVPPRRRACSTAPVIEIGEKLIRDVGVGLIKTNRVSQSIGQVTEWPEFKKYIEGEKKK